MIIIFFNERLIFLVDHRLFYICLFIIWHFYIIILFFYLMRISVILIIMTLYNKFSVTSFPWRLWVILLCKLMRHWLYRMSFWLLNILYFCLWKVLLMLIFFHHLTMYTNILFNFIFLKWYFRIDMDIQIFLWSLRQSLTGWLFA